MSKALDILRAENYNQKCKEPLTFQEEINMKTISASAAPENSNKKRIALIIFSAAYIILILIFHRIYPLLPFYRRDVSTAIQLIGYCIFGISGIILFKDLFAAGFREWKAHPFKNLGLLIGGFLIMMLCDVIMATFSVTLGFESMNQNNVMEALKTAPVLLTFIAIGIMGPVTEETFFRFIMVGKAKEKIPAVICIIVSAVGFGLMHMHALTVSELVSCLPQLTTGLLFAILLVKCKNPTIPVLLHILNNCIGIIPPLMKR